MVGFLGFLVIVAGILAFKGIRIVPQGEEWVVERLGKFHSVITPGLNIIIPLFDTVSYKVTTKDIILDVPEQEDSIENEQRALERLLQPTLWAEAEGQ